MEGGGRSNAAVQALTGEILHVTLTKAGREGGNSSPHMDHKHGEVRVRRGFLKLLITGGKCLFVYMDLQSPGVAGAPIWHRAGSIRINNLGCNLR